MIMKLNESPYRLIAMGKVGSGKSSVLNSLTRTEHFKVGHAVTAETKEVQVLCEKFKGRITSPDIVFIDTPGFVDTGSKDNKAITNVAKCLTQLENGLNIVLFCFPSYEIRLDSSMQCCLKFLRLVMNRAIYEHAIIVLTHGERLSPLELEEAVAKMTTEFIPLLRQRLGRRVREEILVYRKGEDDGLDEVLKYVTGSEKYVSGIVDDLGKFWDSDKPLNSIEYLLQNSKIFNKIQDLLLDAKSENESLREELKTTKEEMRSEAFKENKELKEEIKELTLYVNKQLEQDKNIIEALRMEMKRQLRAMQKSLHEKDKEIEKLKQKQPHKSSASNLLEMASNILNDSKPPHKDSGATNKENLLTEANALYNKYASRNPHEQGSRWGYVAHPKTKTLTSNPASTPRVRVQASSGPRAGDALFKTLNSSRLRDEHAKVLNRTFMAAKRSIQTGAPEKLQYSFRKAEYPKYGSKGNYEA